MSGGSTIVAVETIRWDAQPNAMWLRVHDAAGRSGLGETYYHPAAVAALVHEFAADHVLGQPAGEITRIWDTLYACANFSGVAGAELRMMSALDIALWDLLGQRTGLPVCDLLGGRVRPSIGVYNTCVTAGGRDDGDAFLARPGELARDLLAEGYLGMKVWPWDQFAPQITSRAATGPAGWSAMGPVGHLLTLTDLDAGMTVIDEIRAAVGRRLEIVIEGHSRWDLASAIRLCEALRERAPLWAEDLIQPTSALELRALVQHSPIPIAASERLMGRFAFRDLCASGGAQIAMADVAWTGGITEARRIADLAGAHQLPITFHDCTGPVTAFANAHLGVAMPNASITEVVRGFVDGYYLDVVDRRLPVHAGTVTAPEAPGLGISLRPEFLARPDVHTQASHA